MSGMSRIEKLQQRIDELIVQIDLGKREAVDYVEEHKEHLRSLLEEWKRSLGGSTYQPLKRKLEELELQLQLGKMETRDAYVEQTEKIEQAIGGAAEAFEETRHKAGEEFSEAAQALSDKIRMLGLNLAVGGIIAEDQVRVTRDQVKVKLGNLAANLKSQGEETGEKARELTAESRHAFDEIRSNLRSLFR